MWGACRLTSAASCVQGPVALSRLFLLCARAAIGAGQVADRAGICCGATVRHCICAASVKVLLVKLISKWFPCVLSNVFHCTYVPIIPEAHRLWQELAGSGFRASNASGTNAKPAVELRHVRPLVSTLPYSPDVC